MTREFKILLCQFRLLKACGFSKQDRNLVYSLFYKIKWGY